MSFFGLCVETTFSVIKRRGDLCSLVSVRSGVEEVNGVGLGSPV